MAMAGSEQDIAPYFWVIGAYARYPATRCSERVLLAKKPALAAGSSKQAAFLDDADAARGLGFQ